MKDTESKIRPNNHEGELPDLQSLLPLLLDENAQTPDGNDVETYLSILDSYDMPHDEKLELIHWLSQLIETIIGIQFRTDPVSLAMNQNKRTPASVEPNMVECIDKKIFQTQKNQTAFNKAVSDEKGMA